MGISKKQEELMNEIVDLANEIPFHIRDDFDAEELGMLLGTVQELIRELLEEINE